MNSDLVGRWSASPAARPASSATGLSATLSRRRGLFAHAAAERPSPRVKGHNRAMRLIMGCRWAIPVERSAVELEEGSRLSEGRTSRWH